MSNSLDPDQARRFVGRGLGPNCLQRIVIDFLPAHPASFTHNFVFGMQSFDTSESQDAMVLQTCHEK